MGNGITCDVGIVGFNCYPELELCLDSIYQAEKDALGRIHVVENSSIEIPSRLRESFPDVVWKENRENIGFARACNQIISETASPYIMLLNPDCLVIKGFLQRAMEWLEEHCDTAVLGPRILDSDGQVQASARAFPGLHTAFFGRTSLLTRIFPANAVSSRNLTARSCQDGPKEVDWVSGACMVVRRSAIRKAGLLDEGFFMYWEDCDWCTRFRKCGWKIIYHPGMGPVRHAAGSSSTKVPFLTHFHFHKSAARLYLKYDTTPFRVGSLVAISGALLRFLMLFPGVFLKQYR